MSGSKNFMAWELDEKHLTIFSEDGNCLADFWYHTNFYNKDNGPGNTLTRDQALVCARLAASAPNLLRQRDELLQVCSETLGWLQSFSVPPTSTIQEKQEVVARLETAIANMEAEK